MGVIEEKPYGTKADIFSFGIVLLEILTLEYPYDCLTIAQGSWDTFDKAIVDGLRPPIPEDVPLSIHALVERCWDTEPKNRPSMDQVIEKLNSIERRHVAERSEILESLPTIGVELVKEQQSKNDQLEKQLKLAQEQMNFLTHQLQQEKLRVKQEADARQRILEKKKKFKRRLNKKNKVNESLELELLRLRIK